VLVKIPPAMAVVDIAVSIALTRQTLKIFISLKQILKKFGCKGKFIVQYTTIWLLWFNKN
jgi:hypothetical protein